MMTQSVARVSGVMLLAAALLLGAVAPATAVGSAGAVDCTALQPSADPSINRQAINGCLAGVDRQAMLTPGSYLVDGPIEVPDGARLVGDATYPTVRLVANPGGAAQLVRFTGSGARVGFVRLDAGDLLVVGCCSAVVLFSGAGTGDNQLDDAVVTGASVTKTVGVYVLCRACQGNRMLRVDVHDNFYGVIFGPFNDSGHANTLVDSRVHDNRCDGVTFMGTDLSIGRPGGYGVIDGSSLNRNGRDCANGVPGAAVYSKGNRAGARIVNSRLYENCGNNLDLVDGEHLDIEGIDISTPGYPVPGAAYYCTASASAALVNIRESTIVGNTVRNGNTRTMAGNSGDPNHFFNADGAAKYSDLPGGANGLVAFLLGSWRTGTPSMHNTIDGNRFIGYCASPCVGTGYFATRDTGFDAGGGWSASTTNYYTNNNPYGSNVGSRRGGGNWYAANTVCTAQSSPPPCNIDDYQHATSVNWARNDGFYHHRSRRH